MRKRLLIGGLLLVIVASIGVLRQGAEEPVRPTHENGPPAHRPDLGTGATGPSASAALPSAAPGGPLQTQRLLRARDFATLTRQLEAKQARLEQDIRREDELSTTLSAFAVEDVVTDKPHHPPALPLRRRLSDRFAHKSLWQKRDRIVVSSRGIVTASEA